MTSVEADAKSTAGTEALIEDEHVPAFAGRALGGEHVEREQPRRPRPEPSIGHRPSRLLRQRGVAVSYCDSVAVPIARCGSRRERQAATARLTGKKRLASTVSTNIGR